MTEANTNGGNSLHGRYLTPAEMRARRVELILQLDVGDATDQSTWRIHGRKLNDWQLRVLRRCTPDDWDRAESLLLLDHQLEQDMLNRSRRDWYRRSEGLPPESDAL
jgi:hypothetical protein